MPLDERSMSAHCVCMGLRVGEARCVAVVILVAGMIALVVRNTVGVVVLGGVVIVVKSQSIMLSILDLALPAASPSVPSSPVQIFVATLSRAVSGPRDLVPIFCVLLLPGIVVPCGTLGKKTERGKMKGETRPQAVSCERPCSGV